MIRAIIGFLALLGASRSHTRRAAHSRIRSTERRRKRAGLPSTPISPTSPSATTPAVLSAITGRFSETENTYWGGVHAIAGYERVREIGFRSNGIDYIPRRYCVGRALIDDPRAPPPQRTRPHTIVYNVGANGGMIGWSWGVEWCVVGFDREHAYDPACAVLRPIIERRIGVLKQVNWLGEYGLRARY